MIRIVILVFAVRIANRSASPTLDATLLEADQPAVTTIDPLQLHLSLKSFHVAKPHNSVDVGSPPDHDED